ncbi:MAG: NUDIX hydrolase [Lentisphaerae bacterium]|nr:NUDIX hydrolase [Lentisphaerota bacterium]
MSEQMNRRIAGPHGIATGIPASAQVECLHRNPVQTILRVTGTFDGGPREFFVSHSGERAGMVAVRGGDVLLVRQYRLLVDGPAWEIPGGRVDDGETAEAAAVRECFEETGVTCRQPRLLAFYLPGLDGSHNPTHIYASDRTEDGVAPGGGHAHREIAAKAWIPLDEALQMIAERRIVDCLTMVALLGLKAGLLKRLPSGHDAGASA